MGPMVLGGISVGCAVLAMVAASLLAMAVRRVYRSRAMTDALLAQLMQAHEETENARRHSASKSEFLANMSHEIRTPLNSMVGTAELLLESSLTPHQHFQLHTILNSAEALLYIVNDILDFSKIESGKMALEALPFSPAQLVEEVMFASAPHARERARNSKVELLYALAADLPTMATGDALRIRQILINLLSNAIKFTCKGYVMLRAEGMQEGGLRFTVSDTGIGIPSAQRELIFDKFAQAEGLATTRQFGGTGLGLAICRQLVELMGGSVRVSSKEGKGSAFTVELPLPTTLGEHARSEAIYQGRRALIIEDTGPVAQQLRQLLGELGIRSFVSEDGQAALSTLRHARDAHIALDYVFVEQRLPDATATHLLRALRGDGGEKSPLLIGMSMDDGVLVAQQFARAGGHGYLRKPLNAAMVRQVLEQLDKTPELFFDSMQLQGRAMGAERDYPDYHAFRVLLVEDNRVNRGLALEMLAKFQIEAECAENGKEAIVAAQADRFDLILMDCQMPEMDGFTATRILRRYMQTHDIPETPIIALTANAMKGDRERCLEAGMSDYLSKPLRLLEIRAMLQRWLEPLKKGAAA